MLRLNGNIPVLVDGCFGICVDPMVDRCLSLLRKLAGKTYIASNTQFLRVQHMSMICKHRHCAGKLWCVRVDGGGASRYSARCLEEGPCKAACRHLSRSDLQSPDIAVTAQMDGSESKSIK